MKLRFKALLAATPFLTSFTLHDAALLYATLCNAEIPADRDAEPPIVDQNANSRYYVSSNARWNVDKERGVVSAWALKEERPLWSRDGVVYKTSPRANVAISEINVADHAIPSPALEIFGRVYFLLDDVDDSRSFNKNRSQPRPDALLIALDPNAQGRLVWERRAQDFAPFFPKNARGRLRFIDNVNSSPRDELVVLVQGEKEIKRFALDAATGTPRLLETPAESR